MLTAEDLTLIASVSSSPFLQSLILRGHHCDALRLAEAKDGEVIAVTGEQLARIHEACRMPVYSLGVEGNAAEGGAVKAERSFS